MDTRVDVRLIVTSYIDISYEFTDVFTNELSLEELLVDTEACAYEVTESPDLPAAIHKFKERVIDIETDFVKWERGGTEGTIYGGIAGLEVTGD